MPSPRPRMAGKSTRITSTSVRSWLSKNKTSISLTTSARKRTPDTARRESGRNFFCIAHPGICKHLDKRHATPCKPRRRRYNRFLHTPLVARTAQAESEKSRLSGTPSVTRPLCLITIHLRTRPNEKFSHVQSSVFATFPRLPVSSDSAPLAGPRRGHILRAPVIADCARRLRNAGFRNKRYGGRTGARRGDAYLARRLHG